MTDRQRPSKEEREQRRLRRLGTDQPSCGCCGEDDSCCLELHHVAGKANDPDATVIVCSNCHGKLSDAQLDYPPNASPDDLLKRIGHFLLGLADVLAIAVDKLREFAAVLFAYDAPIDQEPAQ